MAKKPVALPPTQQEDELTVTVFRFRGSSESMQKGFEAFGAALGAALGTGAPPSRPLNGNVRRPPAQQLEAGAGTTDESISVEPADSEGADDEPAVTGEPATAPPVVKGPPRPRKLPKFDNKLAVTPFKAFASGRNPQTVDEKYLVACLWLQEEAQLPSYGASQVFTCFRAMDWTAYDDFTQPMRQLKKNKSYFADTDKRGEWKLNDHGLDEARKINHPANA